MKLLSNSAIMARYKDNFSILIDFCFILLKSKSLTLRPTNAN